MKLYFAVSYLRSDEWTGDTVCSAARNGFELLVRKFVEKDDNDLIAAHVALYFEDVDYETARRKANIDATSFFVDILASGGHQISVFDDPKSWYQKWSCVRVELFEVKSVFKGRKLDVGRSLDVALEYVQQKRVYDFYQNCNSICPSWPTRCSPSLGCCCPCTNGTNCIDATIVALAAGYGVNEWKAREFFDLKQRVALGARLPSQLKFELLESNLLSSDRAKTLLKKGKACGDFLMPLILNRS